MNLKINNSTSLIEGYSQEQFQQLRAILSYEEDPKAGFYSGRQFSTKKYLINKRGEFPTGLLYLVKDWAIVNKLTIKTVDTRVKPKPFLKPLKLRLLHPPYPEQENAAAACQTANRGIVVAPTGLGKTIIAALIISKLQVRTLVVVPSLELKRQLTEFLSSAFGKTHVGGLGSTIAVENVDALDVKQPINYDCVILDEYHHSGAKTYRELNAKTWQNVYFKFGLTATAFRSQEHEKILFESILSKVIFKIDYHVAVKKGYIVPMEAYCYEISKKNTEAYTWAQVYKELVVENQERNDLIANLLNLCNQQKASTLCLVKEIKHGEILSALTGIPFANGIDKESKNLIKEFNKGGSCLIGTTGVLGEGIDTKPAEYVIIAGLGKSKNAFMQQVGRGFRKYGQKESCKIIIFLDRSHKFTLRHYREQVKILKEEYGAEPIIL